MSVGVEVASEDHGGRIARLVLLHDEKGKMLVLLPATALLDLATIWAFTERRLQPVKASDVRRFFTQPQLQGKDGFAKLAGLPLLVDEQCSKHSSLKVTEPYSGAAWQVAADKLTTGLCCQLSLYASQIVARTPEGSDEAVITSAVKRFTRLRIQQRLEDTLGLPSMSPTTQKILMLRSDPDADIEDLVEVVRVDPSLSAQVMSWAASPYYAAPGKISSVEDAVIRVLGFELVVNMALATAMGRMLTVPETGPRGGTPYWVQAVCCATLAELLCKKMPAAMRPEPGLAYLGGLLHNFGYLVLSHLFPPQFTVLSRYIEANPHFSLEAVEQQVLNVTREQVGGWLLDNWALPEEVCEAIRYQNNRQAQGENSAYMQLLYLANRLLRQQGLSDGPVEAVPEAVPEALGLNAAQVAEALTELMAKDESIRELTALLNSSQS
ncbi:MAG: aminoacyl-tRNA deacylase and HDOD domain-containing protein [Pontibacterium sp.]